MKRTVRKLSFKVETVRNLSQGDLNRVAGGISSAREGLCSSYLLNNVECPPEYTLDCVRM
jgi:hypothetical protein